MVEDKWRPSGEYMEGDRDIIYYIYTYNNFELKEFIDNTSKLTLERRNIFNTYRRIIIHYKDIKRKKHQPIFSRAGVFPFREMKKK